MCEDLILFAIGVYCEPKMDAGMNIHWGPLAGHHQIMEFMSSLPFGVGVQTIKLIAMWSCLKLAETPKQDIVVFH